MSKHTVKRGEAILRTGNCARCGALVGAHRNKTSTIVSKFCSRLCRYPTPEPRALRPPRMSKKVYRYCVICLKPQYGNRWNAVRDMACKAHSYKVSGIVRKAASPWAGVPQLERKRSNAHVRRLRIRSGLTERISRLRVTERDGWKCHICNRKVTERNWSLDHLVPIAAGGAHLYNNVALAHRPCNTRRSATGAAQLRLVGVGGRNL